MEQEILTGNVLPPSSEYAEEPSDVPEGIFGYTLWTRNTIAPHTWVYARAFENPNINAWSHTSWIWPDGAFYVHNRNWINPIAYHYSYFIKGLHWYPRDSADYPPRRPGTTPYNSRPSWAQGAYFSPTYYTVKKYGPNPPEEVMSIPLDVILRGYLIMW
jgi:hypothetical protein